MVLHRTQHDEIRLDGSVLGIELGAPTHPTHKWGMTEDASHSRIAHELNSSCVPVAAWNDMRKQENYAAQTVTVHVMPDADRKPRA